MKEVRLLRSELVELKRCLTTYLGFIFAGASAAGFGLLRLGQMASENDFLAAGLGILTLGLSFMMDFITIIIFYKFNSHNRLAGYCKLLSHEILSDNDKMKLKDLNENFSWPFLIGKLCSLEFGWEKIRSLLNSIQIKDPTIDPKKFEKYFKPKSCPTSIPKSICMIFRAIAGNLKTSSWAFPPYITAICFILCILLYFSSIYIAIVSDFADSVKLLIVFLFFGSIHLIIWNHLIRKLYRLMQGDLTVHSYMLKFLPIRVYYLNKHEIVPRYIDFDQQLECKHS